MLITIIINVNIIGLSLFYLDSQLITLESIHLNTKQVKTIIKHCH